MRSSLTLALVPFVILGCGMAGDKPAESPSAGSPKAASAGKSEDPTVKRRAAEHAHAVAVKRLEQVKLQREADAAARERDLAFARSEVDLAKKKQASYAELEAPNRLAQVQLEVRRVKDSAQESAEELKQIEIMYDGQDLDDKTAEFVVQRGKRQAEQRAQQVGISERNLVLVEHHEVPRERARLDLEVAKKESDLVKLEATIAAERIERDIKLMNAEAELEKTKRELDEQSGSK